MIARRWLLMFLMAVPLLCGSGQAPRKPILFIVHSDSCPPCRIFDKTYSADREFRDALQDAFELRELDWSIPRQRQDAINLGIVELPAYVVIRGDRKIAEHIGFSSSTSPADINAAIADLLGDLNVEWPPASRQPATKPRPPRDTADVTAPRPRPPGDDSTPVAPVSAETIDRQARDGITRLATQSRELQDAQLQTQKTVEQLQTDVAGVRSDVTRSTQQLSEQFQRSHSETTSEFKSVTERLQETLRSTIEQRIQSQLGSRASDISTEISKAAPPLPFPVPAPPASSGITDMLIKIGLGAAATHVGLPIGAAALVAGGISWLVTRRRSRRRPWQSHGYSGPAAPAGPAMPAGPSDSASSSSVSADTVTVIRDTEQRQNTANHYVVKETDRIGEAYKESLRRTVAAYKSDNPGIVDVASKIEHVAKELLRGQDVLSRESHTPRPGIWTD